MNTDNEGDAVTDGDEEAAETRLRTMFMTYEATDNDADTFMIVLGSVAENFRGVRIEEFQDDTVFVEGAGALEALHEMVTAPGRLTDDQRATLDAFSQALSEWDGNESL